MLRPVNISIYEKPFRLRLLAGHSSTCSGLFPASSIVPEIKNDSWFPLRGSLFCKDLSMTLFRDCLIQTELLTIIIHLALRLWVSHLVNLGPPFCLKNRKIETVLEDNELPPKTFILRSNAFGFVSWLCLRPQTWLPSTSTQRDEA